MSAFQLGPLHVEVGGLCHKRFGHWIPDGLHIWLGTYGVHMYWAHSPHQPRITFDRAEIRGTE